MRQSDVGPGLIMASLSCEDCGAFLHDFVSGHASEARRVSVREHLDSCPLCHREWTLLQEQHRVVQSLVAPAPTNLRQNLRFSLAQEAQRRARPANLFWRHRNWALAGTVGISALALILWIEPIPHPNLPPNSVPAALKPTANSARAPQVPPLVDQHAQSFASLARPTPPSRGKFPFSAGSKPGAMVPNPKPDNVSPAPFAAPNPLGRGSSLLPGHPLNRSAAPSDHLGRATLAPPQELNPARPRGSETAGPLSLTPLSQEPPGSKQARSTVPSSHFEHPEPAEAQSASPGARAARQAEGAGPLALVVHVSILTPPTKVSVGGAVPSFGTRRAMGAGNSNGADGPVAEPLLPTRPETRQSQALAPHRPAAPIIADASRSDAAVSGSWNVEAKNAPAANAVTSSETGRMALGQAESTNPTPRITVGTSLLARSGTSNFISPDIRSAAPADQAGSIESEKTVRLRVTLTASEAVPEARIVVVLPDGTMLVPRREASVVWAGPLVAGREIRLDLALRGVCSGLVQVRVEQIMAGQPSGTLGEGTVTLPNPE